MRLLLFTAGAADMYCGSCLRDNALAAELLRRGHDVVLMPVYTPTLTDEPNVSRRRVLFGGISVYLAQNFTFFRRTPQLLDRLWDSRFVLNMAARRSIKVDPRFLGEMTVSMLDGAGGILKKEFDKLVDWIRREPLPDVINLPNSLLISLAAPLKRAFGRNQRRLQRIADEIVQRHAGEVGPCTRIDQTHLDIGPFHADVEEVGCRRQSLFDKPANELFMLGHLDEHLFENILSLERLDPGPIRLLHLKRQVCPVAQAFFNRCFSCQAGHLFRTA